MPSRISIGRSIKQKVARKWKWSTRQQVWVTYFNIRCKPRCTSIAEKRKTRAGRGGAKNTITINNWRRRRLKNRWWKIFWVMEWNHCQFVALSKRKVTIICLRLQEHAQMKTISNNVSNPFFIRIWECKAKAHDIVDKKKLKLIEFVSQY